MKPDGTDWDTRIRTTARACRASLSLAILVSGCGAIPGIPLPNESTDPVDETRREGLRRENLTLLVDQSVPVSAADAAQRGPFKETARAKAALETLKKHRYLITCEGGAEVLGKFRREAWRINRSGAS